MADPAGGLEAGRPSGRSRRRLLQHLLLCRRAVPDGNQRHPAQFLRPGGDQRAGLRLPRQAAHTAGSHRRPRLARRGGAPHQPGQPRHPARPRPEHRRHVDAARSAGLEHLYRGPAMAAAGRASHASARRLHRRGPVGDDADVCVGAIHRRRHCVARRVARRHCLCRRLRRLPRLRLFQCWCGRGRTGGRFLVHPPATDLRSDSFRLAARRRAAVVPLRRHGAGVRRDRTDNAPAANLAGPRCWLELTPKARP